MSQEIISVSECRGEGQVLVILQVTFDETLDFLSLDFRQSQSSLLQAIAGYFGLRQLP